MNNFIKEDFLSFYNKLLIPPDFNEIINAVKGISLNILNESNMNEINNDSSYDKSVYKISTIEEYQKVKTNPSNGDKLINKDKILTTSYDESILKYDCLEGFASLVSHSVVILDGSTDKYIPIIYLTFNFYTKSENIHTKSKYIKYSKEPERQSLIDLMQDRFYLLDKVVPDNSILLIDGPLIAGDAFTYFINKMKYFHEKNIIPIFIVKNSSSNLVTDCYEPLINKYNSDLHWCYNFLKVFERTNFFRYQDRQNSLNTKAFCYLKTYDRTSPQRIEMHMDTYNKYSKLINNIMDIIVYLMLVQGDIKNPQTRTIFVAEKYARSAISFYHIESMIKNIGLIPTINQSRFGD